MTAPTWDWEHPYPGGPAVTNIELPRPLHAPGTPGYPASTPGPDIEAAKRCISRAGRWPWQTFDQAYSKQFAHGKPGGNVKDSGVAGYQRQQGWEGSGNVGEKTYNSWRNARIPDGLPNAGEPIMDTLAINLFAEAFYMFQPPPPATGLAPDDVRLQALEEAQTQLGYTEGANNDTKYGAWYGANYQPWCAMFTTWCYIGAGSGCFLKGSRYAYVPYLVADAQNGRYGLSITSSPMAGDLVAYDWSGGDYDHIGIFQSGSASSWNAIEGNTSPDNNGSQSNGGGVYRRNRTKTQAAKVAFVRVTG